MTKSQIKHEYGGLLTSNPSPTGNYIAKNASGRPWKPIILTTCIALLCGYQFITNLNPNTTENKVKIEWSTCPDEKDFDCGYLTVPMNYLEPNPNDTVSIFLRKFPATAPREAQLGSLFMNPGGPGGSGSATLVSIGRQMSAVVQGRYDIVSWDPRGVNMTTPSLDCFSADSFSMLHQLSLQHLGMPFEARGPPSWSEKMKNESEFRFAKKLDKYYQAPARACEERGNYKMLQSVSTSFVVRDMVEMLKALGEEEKGLTYWGFSYGTILGATFAAQHPNLVHRMVLDGVSDAVAYGRNLWEWSRSGIHDARKTTNGFFDLCKEAGPERCSFAGATEAESSTSLSFRLQGLYDALIEEPLVVENSQAGFGVLTASDLQLLFFETLYNPRGWQRFAQGLAEAEKGNGTILYEQMYIYFSDIRKDLDGTKNPFHHHVERYGSFISTLSILCSDAPPMNASMGDAGTRQYIEYIHELAKISPTGDSWSMWPGFCRHWNIRTTEVFDGPWNAEEGREKTRNPLLLISMTGDPVTPLTAAKKMAAVFGSESASLLVQEGFGHTSLAQPSTCTAKNIRNYFLSSKIPELGTRCKSDPGYVFPQTGRGLTGSSEGELAQSIFDLSEAAYNARLGMGRGIRR